MSPIVAIIGFINEVIMKRQQTRPMRASMRYLVERGESPEYKPDVAALQEALAFYIKAQRL